MSLNFIQKDNSIAKDIIKYFQTQWGNTSWSNMEINGEKYLEIKVNAPIEKLLYSINSRENISKTYDKDYCQQFLNLNNISFGKSTGETVIKSCDVLIFDGSILSIKLINFNKSGKKIKYVKEESVSNMAAVAKKSSYLLGLDFAVVKLILTGKRKIKVLSINPAPQLRKKDLHKLIKSLDKLKDALESMNGKEIMLGADPEFMIANSKNGKMIPASRFFPKEGMVGCDNIRIPSRQQRPVAEVRPLPDISPQNLAENIRQAFIKANKMAPYRNIKWLAGSQPFSGYSTGGHIHFSNVKLNNHILRAFDNYIGLVIFMIEDPVTASKRRKKYGFLGDYRLKDHGGFEYRTTGSWIITPEICLAVLCLAKLVASRYHLLVSNYLSNLEAQKAFYKSDHEFFHEIINVLWSELESLDLYRDYAEELAPLKNMLSNREIWDEKADMRLAWGLKTKFAASYNIRNLNRNRKVKNSRRNRGVNARITTRGSNRGRGSTSSSIRSGRTMRHTNTRARVHSLSNIIASNRIMSTAGDQHINSLRTISNSAQEVNRGLILS